MGSCGAGGEGGGGGREVAANEELLQGIMSDFYAEQGGAGRAAWRGVAGVALKGELLLLLACWLGWEPREGLRSVFKQDWRRSVRAGRSARSARGRGEGSPGQSRGREDRGRPCHGEEVVQVGAKRGEAGRGAEEARQGIWILKPHKAAWRPGLPGDANQGRRVQRR